MSQRKWGNTVNNVEPQFLSLEEHVDNWIACTELALRYQVEEQMYVRQFERLIADPYSESQAIFRFLNMEKGKPFEPQKKKEVGFGPSEAAYIWECTAAARAALEEIGISYMRACRPKR